LDLINFKGMYTEWHFRERQATSQNIFPSLQLAVVWQPDANYLGTDLTAIG